MTGQAFEQLAVVSVYLFAVVLMGVWAIGKLRELI